QARSPALPGSTFEGKVQAILPEVNPATRTLKARLELANPGGRLVPGMSVQMQFMDSRADKALLVPTEAVIQTGKRMVVMLAEDQGRFRPVNVEVGIESGGQTEIKSGLQAGQRVVVSSQFLIDSEASLKGVEARLNGQAAPALPRHPGEAQVVSIDKDSALLAHGPLPTAGMGAMTMEFKAPATGMPRNVAKGDRVQFEFVLPKDGEPTLTYITPIAPTTPQAIPTPKTPVSGAAR
ncbi:MAG: copper-binding protein, partial [Polaromonas sp.]